MVRFFSASENSIVVCHPDGIHLYHIPELGSVGDSSTLVPIWSWSGGSNQYYGTLYDTDPQHPRIYLQGSLITHDIDFGLDESGFLVVLSHTATGGQPAYCVFDEERSFVLKGRKGVCYCMGGADGYTVVLKTLLLGREHTTGVFRIRANESVAREGLSVQDLKVDLDEVTGRLLVAVESVTEGNLIESHVRKLWLADSSV